MSIKLKVILKSQTLKKVLMFSLAGPLFELEFGSFDEEFADGASSHDWDLLVVEVDHDYNEDNHSKVLGIKKAFPGLKSLKIVDELGKIREWGNFDDQIDRLFEVGELKGLVNKLLPKFLPEQTLQNLELESESEPEPETETETETETEPESETEPETLFEGAELSDLNDEWDIDEEFECLEVESEEINPYCVP